MRVRTSNVTKAKTAWWAIADRNMRNTINKLRFTDAEQARAWGMVGVLDYVYASKGVYINYNKNSISIKIDSARVRDNKALAEAEVAWQDRGVTKLVTNQGISYTIAR